MHTWLVVCVRCESLSLLGGDRGVAFNKFRHHTTSCLQAHGQWGYIEKQKVLNLRGAFSSKDCSLDSCTICDSLIRVDGLAWLLAIEELLNHGLHLWDTRGPSNKHHFMHVLLIDATVTHALLYRTHGVAEVIHAELLEASTRQRTGVVNTIKERVDLDSCLCGGGQSTLRPLTLCAQTSDCTMLASKVLATVLPLEVLNAEVHNAIIKVLASKVRVTCSGFHLEDPIFNRQQGDIEGTSTHIVDQHVALARGLLVKTIRDGCSSGFVDDPEYIQTSNGACILGGLALRVVEVSRDRDNGIVHFSAKVGLSCLLHLHENHGANFFCMKLFVFTHGIHHNDGLVPSAALNFERPQLDICLNGWIIELATNEPFGIKDSVLWIACNLVLCRITNQALRICECNV